MQSRRLLLAVAIAVIGAIYYYCNQQVNPVTGEKQHVAMSQDQEVAMGLQTAPEMEAQFGGLHPDLGRGIAAVIPERTSRKERTTSEE